ncbi:MAG: response regulator [Polyangiaceae bacterium]|nr:response regulator [Polyangiaceae bacterium]
MLEGGGIPKDVIDLMAVGVWIARAPGGELVFANEVFREIMGMGALDDQKAGGYAAPYGIFNLAGEPYPETELPFARAVRQKKIVRVDDLVIHRADRTRVNVRATARPWLDAAGEVELVVISFEDITPEVEARAARGASEERMRQTGRLEALGTLAAGVAHDFNNVLTTIGSIASQMRMRDPQASQVADLLQIEAAVMTAAQLTRALLAFGRVGSGNITRFDFASTVRGVLGLVRRTFEHELDVVIEQRGSAMLEGDRAQIEQMCLNLIVNARDAMPDGGTMRLEVDSVDLESPPIPLCAGRHVVLTVSDTGKGIPRELRHRIFEPYFTTKTGLDRPGTGLGLATVYSVAQAFGGLVELDDAVPHGAIFRVTLPVNTKVRADRPAAVPATKGTILVVDDEALVRQVTRRSLEQMGYAVLEAGDGLEALDVFAAERSKIDLVLLDAVMPRLSGQRAMARLRELAPDLPIVVSSGRLGADDAEGVMIGGATAVLFKPFTASQLAEAIASVLKGRPPPSMCDEGAGAPR